MLRALMPVCVGAPHSLGKKQREEREKDTRYLMPQRASGMGQPLPKGLAGVSPFCGHAAALRQIYRSFLLGSRARLLAETVRRQPCSAPQLATQSDISHDRKV